MFMFSDEETEAQGREMTSPRPHSTRVAESGIEQSPGLTVIKVRRNGQFCCFSKKQYYLVSPFIRTTTLGTKETS